MPALPESVKIAKWSGSADNALEYSEIPIKCGAKQVSLLLAIKYNFTIDVEGFVWTALWKRSAPAVKADLLTTWWWNDDIIDVTRFNFLDLLAAGGASQNGRTVYQVLPFPVVLLRSPQLVTYSDGVSIPGIDVFCWYVNQDVSDQELARLMVKDHD